SAPRFLEERQGSSCKRHEGVGADVDGGQYAVARDLVKAASKILGRRESDRMDKDVEALPACVDLRHQAIHVFGFCRIAGDDRHLLAVWQRPDELGHVRLETLVNGGEGRAAPFSA